MVLDTSALSAAMHRDPVVLARLEALSPWATVLCSPVAAEIRFGLARLVPGSNRRRLLTREYDLIRGVIRWVDWREGAADIFGRIKADLESRGTMIEDFDIAIASVALHLGASVATRNVRHFERIDGLEVEDWSA